MDDARRQQLIEIVAAKAGVDAACAARHLALHDDEVAAALRGIDAERYTLTQRLLNKYRRDPEDALQHVALAVQQQEQIGTDSVLRAGRIAALSPPASPRHRRAPAGRSPDAGNGCGWWPAGPSAGR